MLSPGLGSRRRCSVILGSPAWFSTPHPLSAAARGHRFRGEGWKRGNVSLGEEEILKAAFLSIHGFEKRFHLWLFDKVSR